MKTFKKSLSLASIFACMFHITHCMNQQYPITYLKDSLDYIALSHGDEIHGKQFLASNKNNQQLTPTSARQNNVSVNQQIGFLNALNKNFSDSDAGEDMSDEISTITDQESALARKNSFPVTQKIGLLNTADKVFCHSEDESEETNIDCFGNNFNHLFARCCVCFRKK